VTSIPYELKATENVVFIITDISGKEVLRSDEGKKTAGKHIIKLDVEGLRSGLYYYTLKAGDFIKTHSLTILKHDN
jgi:hypothetical protein